MMKVYKDISALPHFRKAVVTIGTFDGVHIGHRQIIAQLKKEATAIGGENVLVTFDPHPRKIVTSKPLQLINTLEEKIELLEAQGIDNLVIVPFTSQFAQQAAEAYVVDFLVEKFHPHTVIIGYDHRFGKDRTGNFKLLEAYAAKHFFKLIEISPQVIDEITISSTKIREALLRPDVEEAHRLLGYHYFFEGCVIEGNKLGRTLGYPTANLLVEAPDKLIPGNGVYAVEVELKDNLNKPEPTRQLKGMMNIGFRPTVNGSKLVIEVNIFDFDQDIYGSTLRIYLLHYLRGEQKFSGLDALKNQLARDKEEAIALLK
jgi:riboflavin kinase / FMN adenylyltransferase